MPLTVVSSTLEGPLDWQGATVVSGDAADIVARLKEESEVPLRSHGSPVRPAWSRSSRMRPTSTWN
jgi:hypothetical protein